MVFSLLESEKSFSIFRSIIMMMACDIFFILEFIFLFNYTFLDSTPDVYSSKECSFSCSTHFKATDSSKRKPVIPWPSSSHQKSLLLSRTVTVELVRLFVWGFSFTRTPTQNRTRIVFWIRKSRVKDRNCHHCSSFLMLNNFIFLIEKSEHPWWKSLIWAYISYSTSAAAYIDGFIPYYGRDRLFSITIRESHNSENWI